MYRIDFNHPCHIHFIGIGGISMSGLAEILLDEHFTVSGSDARLSPLTEKLTGLGATIYQGHRCGNILETTDLVVYTAAVKEDNPEYVQALALNIPILTRAELLGQLMANYENSIGIAGTHGKTTTTSMLTHILLAADADPTISIGGILPAINGNIKIGHSELFVTEACEYTNSFLSFQPNMAIVLNIEADHLDFFKDIDDIRNSFHLYMKKLPDCGLLVINRTIQHLEDLVQDLNCSIVTFDIAGDSEDIRSSKVHYQAAQVTFDEYACPTFTLLRYTDAKPETLGSITLCVPGTHNIYNALSVIALAAQMGIPFDRIQEGLLQYCGTKRRFEKKGELGGITIIDDYAHHPDEIRATLTAAANYPHRKIWCVFQPHTYTRTKALMDDFAEALALSDEVILADIYPARETDTLGTSSAILQQKVVECGTSAHHFSSFDEIEKFILENCINGDLLITMGAGDIVKVGESLLGN